MNDHVGRVGLRFLMCPLVLGVGVALISFGGKRASLQGNLVRVVSPADFVLQPHDPVTGMTKLDFAFDPRVAYATLTTETQGAFTLPATAKTLSWGLCGSERTLASPNDILMHYEAYDSASRNIESGNWHFKLGPDTTKPTVRIVSPKNGTLVAPGDVLEIVVDGEEDKSATAWQSGLRRLTLVDSLLNQQTSPELPQRMCEGKQWTQEHRFRYVVPRDAQGGQIISLTAGAEDWAKNPGSAHLDLIAPSAYAGQWTTKGRFTGPQNTEIGFAIEAVFSFTIDPHSGAVMCGTATQPYCGSAKVTFEPGHSKDCVVTRTPPVSVFKIKANGVRKNNDLTMLTLQSTQSVPIGYQFVCGRGKFDTPGRLDVPVGSIQPEGITIALPLRDHTKVRKNESTIGNASPTVSQNSFINIDIEVELYKPRENR